MQENRVALTAPARGGEGELPPVLVSFLFAEANRHREGEWQRSTHGHRAKIPVLVPVLGVTVPGAVRCRNKTG